MALPKAFPTPEIERVLNHVRSITSSEQNGLPSLGDRDLHMIGSLVQHYCFIDVNLRRAAEIFYLAKMLPKAAAKQYPDIQDALITDAVASAVSFMDPDEENVAEAMGKLGLLNSGRVYRNLVCHFSMRKQTCIYLWERATKMRQRF
jgi:hypothetical protein